jgi:hypothetical protein
MLLLGESIALPPDLDFARRRFLRLFLEYVEDIDSLLKFRDIENAGMHREPESESRKLRDPPKASA